MSTLVDNPVTPTLHASATWLEQARAACDVIPPLWPLQNFIAVNPFLGLAGRPFLEAARLLESAAHQAPLMDAEFFAERLRSGAVLDEDLEAALRLLRQHHAHSAVIPDHWTPTHLKLWVHGGAGHASNATKAAAMSDLAGSGAGGSWTTVVTGEIAKFCAAYYDEGQASWRLPWASLPLFQAWREFASHDKAMEWHGLPGFRSFVKALPVSPHKAVVTLLNALGLEPDLAALYLRRLLLTVFGWASHVRYRVRENELKGIPDDSLLHLLAIRLACDAALAENESGKGKSVREEWLGRLRAAAAQGSDEDLLARCAWQWAVEVGYQRRLTTGLTAARKGSGADAKARPQAQAVFCIDVRSEVFRRSLEAQSDQVETLGFAGFFGMPIEHIPFGRQHGHAQCPALIQPQFRVRERPAHATENGERRLLAAVLTARRLRHAWNAFKSSAISCFSFVETAGLGFLFRLATGFAPSAAAGGLPKPTMEPHVHQECCEGDHVPSDMQEARTGIPANDQVELAHGALRNMGLTRDFARLVLICGHGASTVNNPYASSLDCGACGGHSGEANARVAAKLLNEPTVRAGLREKGILVPEDTWFVAGLHDTTTDEVTLFADDTPASHRDDIEQLRGWLSGAGHDTRCQRSVKLGQPAVNARTLLEEVQARAADWSQVRPEWGLAGNAAFVAAPRERTRHLNLGGRVFLHNYHHELDEGNATLELILSAPVVVASWINLQYYASTVNNALYGSGNKVLHNVVGTLGVCLGNGGDLRAGLPLQSLHNGQTWMHEPLRLSVFIEAPREHLCLALSRLPETRALFDHGWLHLFAIEPDEGMVYRYEPEYDWEAVTSASSQPVMAG